MRIFTAYTEGFKETGGYPRMLGVLYVLNLLFALLLAIPFYLLAKSSAGNSMLPQELLNGFNFTAITEWLREAGSASGLLIMAAVCMGIAYYLLSVFLSGGILRSLNRSSFSMNQFFAGSGYNFFRFLAISAIILLIQIVFAALVFGGLSAILDNMSNTAQTEGGYFWWSVGGGVLYLLLWLFWSVVSDYAKFYLLLNDSFNVFAAFFRTFIFVIKHFYKTYVLRLLLFITPLPIWYIYYKLTNDIVGATVAMAIGLLILRQLFVFARIWFRLWTFSSQFELYSEYFIHEDLVNSERMRLAKWEREAERSS